MTKAELIDDCLFCKITAAEIPSYTVFERRREGIFGHFPGQRRPRIDGAKEALDQLFDYSAEDASRFMQYVPGNGQGIQGFDPRIQAMNITSNNGEIAGQVVMHSHIHFIPRWEGDGIKFFTRNNADQYDEKKYQEVCDRIKAQF